METQPNAPPQSLVSHCPGGDWVTRDSTRLPFAGSARTRARWRAVTAGESHPGPLRRYLEKPPPSPAPSESVVGSRRREQLEQRVWSDGSAVSVTSRRFSTKAIPSSVAFGSLTGFISSGFSLFSSLKHFPPFSFQATNPHALSPLAEVIPAFRRGKPPSSSAPGGSHHEPRRVWG